MDIEKGWSPDFDYKDKMHHRTTPELVPQNPVNFIKGIKTAWKVYRTTNNNIVGFWKVADLINGYFKNHRTYDTIGEVFEKE